jgi:gas vesicle protein
MSTTPAATADEIADSIRSLVDRMVDSKFTHEVTKAGAEVEARAEEAWRESRPLRQDVARTIAHAGDDAAKWYRKSLRPLMRDLWKRRIVALGAIGAAVPAATEVVEDTAVRLGIRERREERHWGAFFLGLLIGVAGGAIAAMLITPKRGDEMRRELGERADEIATKARDEWVPIFEQAVAGNGHPDQLMDDLAEGAADAAKAVETAVGDAVDSSGKALEEAADAAERVVDDTADAVGEAIESSESEPRAQA